MRSPWHRTLEEVGIYTLRSPWPQKTTSHYGMHVCATSQPQKLPPIVGNDQEQALRTERFQQNQILFRQYTTMDTEITKQIIMLMQPVFLSPLVYQLTGFGQFSVLQMLQHLFTYYWVIAEIDLGGNTMKMMGTYNPEEPLSHLFRQL